MVCYFWIDDHFSGVHLIVGINGIVICFVSFVRVVFFGTCSTVDLEFDFVVSSEVSYDDSTFGIVSLIGV